MIGSLTLSEYPGDLVRLSCKCGRSQDGSFLLRASVRFPTLSNKTFGREGTQKAVAI
jgi:hypothetical protein